MTSTPAQQSQDLIDKRNNSVRFHAKVGTQVIVPYKFIPTGHLYVDDRDTDSYIGELCYINSNYETGGALKVRDWIFALERMLPEARQRLAPKNNPDVWVIGGFHEHSHYSFTTVTAVSQKELNQALLHYVLTKFWPILHPEVFDTYLKQAVANHQHEDFHISWKTSPLKALVPATIPNDKKTS